MGKKKMKRKRRKEKRKNGLSLIPKLLPGTKKQHFFTY